jgi:hypothetical protein
MSNLTLKKLCAILGAGVLALSVLPAAQAISVAPGYDSLTAFAPSGAISVSDAIKLVQEAGPARIPDSGTTFSLLGIAVAGLAFLRRKLG